MQTLPMGWVCSIPNILTVAYVIETFLERVTIFVSFYFDHVSTLNGHFCLQAQKGSNSLLLQGQKKSNSLDGEYFYPEAHTDVQKIFKATNWYVL